MRLTAFVIALSCVAGSIVESSAKASPTAADVTTELSRRSGIPEAELSGLLADCDANQQSMNLCAHRDLVASELSLKESVRAKLEQFPMCKSAIETRLARFEKNRDAGCTRSAEKAYGKGSMQPLARAQCAKAETDRMSEQLSRYPGCRSR